MSVDVALALEIGDLHGSLSDPLMGTIGFLNEVMDRFPDAISFAPGAPHLRHLDELDITGAIDRYVAHVARLRGVPASTAWRTLYEYGPAQGVVRDLVAGALRADLGVDAVPNGVVITVGAQEGMLLTLRALCRNANDLLAVVSPCYVGITGAARLLDIRVVPVRETADGLDVDGLAAACTAARRHGQRIRGLYVAPDFANPSGTLLDLAARHRVLAAAQAHDFVVVEDTAYGFTAPSEHRLPTLKALDRNGRVILIGTFAKVCLPGARVGYVLADQPVRYADGAVRFLAEELAVLKAMVTVNTSPICQAVIGGMLLEHGGSLTTLGARRASLYRHNLADLLGALERHRDRMPPGVTWSSPSGGFFVRMRLPVPADVAALEHCASAYGVLWTPMAPFYLDGSGRDELRLSCSYLDRHQIEEGVRRLTDFLTDATDGGRQCGS